MEINDLNPNAFADMFSTQKGQEAGRPQNLNFGMEQTDQDIFNTGLETAGAKDGVAAQQGTQTDDKTAEEIEAERIAAEAIEAAKTDDQGKLKDADILGDGKGTKKVEEAKPLQGLQEYFEKRTKEGKFVAINDVDETGKKVPFIPKTEEDFDEVIEMQVSWKLQEAKKTLDKTWYEGKSSAWKAISQYAELTDDPTQLIPFLQGVKTIQSVASFDENEIDGAEQIMRTRLEQTGNPQEVIDVQIEALKTTDKLISTAKTVKPLIIQQEQQALSQQIQAEKKRDAEYQQMVHTISENAFKAIEQPIFGKAKLKHEEKAAIYDLIGQPSEETKGYAIYTEIDKLFDKGDFDKLRKIALLLTKEDSFYGYLGTDISNKTAAGLQRKLQLATDSRTASGNDFDEDKVKGVTRTGYNKQLRFGGDDN